MSVVTKLRPSAKPAVPEPRAILGPTGNRVRVLEQSKRKTEMAKKTNEKPALHEMPEVAVKKNLSVDSTCSSESSSSSYSSGCYPVVKIASSGGKNVKRNGVKTVKVVHEEAEVKEGPVKRCDWITSNSDSLYTTFHDEEWGVPVHDDKKLFELLVFSQALAELSWPTILQMRGIFRKLLVNFDPLSVAQFSEKQLLSLKVNGSLILSEPKLRAIVENAKQILKVQEQFGSFSIYCWRFVNHKPLQNGFRYARQVPVKTPKAELISKDMMQRGFRCVGPIVIYSFMQVAGIANDHLITCFRYQECNTDIKMGFAAKIKGAEVLTKALENTCLSHDLVA